jgi:hypothetical protein
LPAGFVQAWFGGCEVETIRLSWEEVSYSGRRISTRIGVRIGVFSRQGGTSVWSGRFDVVKFLGDHRRLMRRPSFSVRVG